MRAATMRARTSETNGDTKVGLSDTTVLVTVTGPDRPGLTSVLFTALSRHEVHLLDVEQVVIRGRLTLGVLLRCPNDAEALQEELEEAMDTVGMHVDVEIGADSVERAPVSTHAVVVLGSPLTARALRAVSRNLAKQGANIDSIRGIADYPVTGLELLVTASSTDTDADSNLRTGLAEVAAEENVDIAVERAGLARRAKRLIVFDVDSTLIQGEVIEMLAARAGVEAEVRAVTESAMRGEIDFSESLHQRVATLAGLPTSVLHDARRRVRYTPGVGRLAATVRATGGTVAVVSGGFQEIVDQLVAQGCDRLFTVPGESFLAVLDALVDTPSIEVVPRVERVNGMPAAAAAISSGVSGLSSPCL